MADTKVFALDEGKNAYETLTREQITAAIMQAVNEGTIGDLDAGFITKVQEINQKGLLRFWVGSMAEFNALETKDADTLYLFSDDPTVDDIEEAITAVENDLEGYKDLNDLQVAYCKGQISSLSTRVTALEQGSRVTLYPNLAIEWGAAEVSVEAPEGFDLLSDHWTAVIRMTAEETTGGTTSDGTIFIHEEIDFNAAQSGYDQPMIYAFVGGSESVNQEMRMPVRLYFTSHSIGFRAMGVGESGGWDVTITSITFTKED